jgi:hypothetical protein
VAGTLPLDANGRSAECGHDDSQDAYRGHGGLFLAVTS